jgi:hypothetical protein
LSVESVGNSEELVSVVFVGVVRHLAQPIGIGAPVFGFAAVRGAPFGQQYYDGKESLMLWKNSPEGRVRARIESA